jgi:alkylhydroperoxidase family enzyme
LGVNPEMLESLVRDIDHIPDPKLRDMIRFSLKCSRNPQGLTDRDYATLRERGLSQPEILEIIAMSALAVYANILADATAMESDGMFNTL